MPNPPDSLAEMHDLIARCRRMAIDVADPETARSLAQLADELEQCVFRATFGALDTKRDGL
jgi:hypothetical protein